MLAANKEIHVVIGHFHGVANNYILALIQAAQPGSDSQLDWRPYRLLRDIRMLSLVTLG